MASTLPIANPCCDSACSGISITITYPSLAGHGSPQGVVLGTFLGQTYTDLDTGNFYKYIGNPVGTLNTNNGWV